MNRGGKWFATWLTFFAMMIGGVACFAAAPLKFAEIERIVESQLHSLRLDHPGAIVSQRDVKSILNAIERAGWRPDDFDSIVDSALPDSHPLVQKLRSPRGRAFSADVAKLSQGYDRLDHLSRLADGPAIIDRLIDTPDGYKLIEYMTNSGGGKELGTMLSSSPGGKDFNKATGRIYTPKQLRDRLEQSHRASSSKRPKKRR